MIEHLEWAQIIVDGQTFKDAKVSVHKSWEWRFYKDHTITLQDFKDVMDDADEVILCKGMANCVSIDPDVLSFAKEQEITVHVLGTKEAVKKYNQLKAEGKKVAGIFHTTC